MDRGGIGFGTIYESDLVYGLFVLEEYREDLKKGNGDFTFMKRILIVSIMVSLLVLQSGCKPKLNNEMPDEYNAYGNSASNIVNGGLVAKQGNWIYFANGMSSSLLNWKSGLNKIQTDGINNTRIAKENPHEINVVGEWIYFITIYHNLNNGGMNAYKVQTNGTNKQKLSDDYVGYLNVFSDWIYYINYSDNDTIYKMNTDGTQKSQIANEQADSLLVYKDSLFYKSAKDYKLYKMSLTGENKAAVIEDRIYMMTIDEVWIYYINLDDNKSIYKVQTSGTNRTKINDSASENLFVEDGLLYYRDSDRDLCIMDIDGNGYKRVGKINTNYHIGLIDHWIYFISNESGKESQLYKMNAEGETVRVK